MPQHSQSASVRSTAKDGEPDRYLAALLAKPPQRDSLIALAAFGSEIARIQARVHDPLLQVIRLQWWRDTLLAAHEAGRQSGHPVADAVASIIRLHDLPLNIFENIIDAWDGDPGPAASAGGVMSSNPELATSRALFQLGAIVCDTQPSPTLHALTDDAGAAYGIARMLLKAAHDGDIRELNTTCLAHLKAARQAVQALPRNQRLVFLPLALVQPYLHLAQASTGSQASFQAEISPLSRIWRIWLSYCTARP